MPPRIRSIAAYLRENSSWLFPTIAMVVGGIFTYATFNFRLDTNTLTDARQDVEIKELKDSQERATDKARIDLKELSISVHKIEAGQARMEGKMDLFLQFNQPKTVSYDIN